MTRLIFGFMCVLALGIMGCGETSGTGGTGGEGGSAGMAGEGGQGGGGVGGDGGNCVEPLDVAGEWLMTATPIEDTCDGDLTPYMFGLTIIQEGNALAGQTFGATFPGTICGNQIQVNGSFSEYGETTTVNLQLTVSADGNSVEGSDTWNWTDGVESCGGSGSLNGTRIDAPPGWTCPAEYYGTADGCDCGCGALDPDCIDGTVASCEYCDAPGSCSGVGCPGDIDPAQNWVCEGGTAVCGDGVSEPPEQCDEADLQGLDCTDFGFTGGTLACTANCTFDTSGCTGGPVCGDDTIQSPEICDGTDLGLLTGLTCADLGFTGGTLACNATCENFDLTACAGGPPGWTCPAEYYGTGDGCDCGCGALDPDCIDGTVASCEYCGEPGSCSPALSSCPGDIDPAQNWVCGGTGGTSGSGGVRGN